MNEKSAIIVEGGYEFALTAIRPTNRCKISDRKLEKNLENGRKNVKIKVKIPPDAP